MRGGWSRPRRAARTGLRAARADHALGARITEAAQAEMPAATRAMEARLHARRAGLRTIDPGALEAMTKRIQGHLAANPDIAGELEKKFRG